MGVVGDIEAGAFELDGGRRNQLLESAAALPAFLERLVPELLQGFGPGPAFLAFIFMNGHGRSRLKYE